MDDGAPTCIEKILAHAAITCPPSLPSPNMGQSMFYGDPLTQPGAPLWGLLTFSQFDEQGFIRMNADAAAFRAGGTLRFQWTLSAYLFGKVDNSTRLKGHLLLSRTANRPSIPIQDKRLL